VRADDVVKRVAASIADGSPKELLRAACFSLVVDDYEGLTRAHIERLHELSRAWWARYDALTDEQLAELDDTTLRYYRQIYHPPTPEPAHDETSGPREPRAGMTRIDLPPISDQEARWIVRCLQSEDHMREFGHYARLVKDDGALPIEPLLSVEKVRVYGHAIAPEYRTRRLARPWSTRRRRWEYELIEDALLAACIRRGRLTGRERNRVAWRLVPYMPLLAEKTVGTHTKRIESALVRRGVFERISRQCVRVTEQGERIVREQLIASWIKYAVREG
jgi:hypothetical protein